MVVIVVVVVEVEVIVVVVIVVVAFAVLPLLVPRTLIKELSHYHPCRYEKLPMLTF